MGPKGSVCKSARWLKSICWFSSLLVCVIALLGHTNRVIAFAGHTNRPTTCERTRCCLMKWTEHWTTCKYYGVCPWFSFCQFWWFCFLDVIVRPLPWSCQLPMPQTRIKTPLNRWPIFTQLMVWGILGFKLGFFFRTIFTPTMSDEF